MPNSQDALKQLKPQHSLLIGIDSDGCVFDTMEIKQKQCFHPNLIKYWNLEAISAFVNEVAQFVNLYSKWRGTNRFPALAMTFDLLRERPEVLQSKVPVPELHSLKKWIQEETQLGNATLEAKVKATGDKELAQVLEWSLEVNRTISRTVKNIGPFAWVRETLEAAKPKADLIVVSQTPVEALVREWQEHQLDGLVRFIAGQEHGTKTEHLQMAGEGKYPAGHVLMIGDAPGDRKAAEANGAYFYPVHPGLEENSWEKLYRKDLNRFLKGEFTQEYQQQLIQDFEKRLPDRPPWK